MDRTCLTKRTFVVDFWGRGDNLMFWWGLKMEMCGVGQAKISSGREPKQERQLE